MGLRCRQHPPLGISSNLETNFSKQIQQNSTIFLFLTFTRSTPGAPATAAQWPVQSTALHQRGRGEETLRELVEIGVRSFTGSLQPEDTSGGWTKLVWVMSIIEDLIDVMNHDCILNL